MSLNEIRYNIQQQFNYVLSTSTIYRWLDRFLKAAEKKVKDVRPKVYNSWVAEETTLKINGKKYWIWDLFDIRTQFLIASRLSPNRSAHEGHALIAKAKTRAGKAPKVIYTDGSLYGKMIEQVSGARSIHKTVNTFSYRAKVNIKIIKRFQGKLKARDKVLERLKKPETVRKFLEGWLINYNYFSLNLSLNDLTPAQKAGVNILLNDWTDLVRQPRNTAKIEISQKLREAFRLNHQKTTGALPG
jgi:transposase-like protein